MNELLGWILDLYEDPRDGAVLWIITREGERRKLSFSVPVSFYVAGSPRGLVRAAEWLGENEAQAKVSHTCKEDILQRRFIPVLDVLISNPYHLSGVFHRLQKTFPSLTYYDADVSVALRYAARFGIFPLAECRLYLNGDIVENIIPLGTPWDLDVGIPRLRTLRLGLDAGPKSSTPARLHVACKKRTWDFSLARPKALLINLVSILERYDPDIIIAEWGDSWLLNRLSSMAEENNINLPLNRDLRRGLGYKPPRSYFSYGQIIFRDQYHLLYGRLHIDPRNAMFYGDYGLEGIFETARVTRLPIQTAARVSPGTGISSMQIVTALKKSILVPWHKQAVEQPKTALRLIQSDRGGLLYSPPIGLFKNVAEVDFISMYPGIMVRCNLSPESEPGTLDEMEGPPGLIPLTLGPLLEKRVALKRRYKKLPDWDPRKQMDKAMASAQKWLLVTCFGYLGYKNARFGRIEAHEKVTEISREALLRAKEAAEDMGFEVLHMLVDSLHIYQENMTESQLYNPLLEEIESRTHLPIAFEGIYKWVVYPASRMDARISVPNRYFGVFQDGEIKIRGIEARRRDTPVFVANLQMEILEYLAEAPDADSLPGYIPGALLILRRRLADLRSGRFNPDEMTITNRLTRELDAYVANTAAARAGRQLRRLGKTLSPGERVRYFRVRDKIGVRAFVENSLPDPSDLDILYYEKLLVLAAETVLLPLGLDRGKLYSLTRAIPACQEPLPSMAEVVIS
ncbi:MAG: hypothetical protein MUO76_03230 [Anaerolineaceae bacterium]|nr:hypothetical protein [Anaerolineaceae bacterium]